MSPAIQPLKIRGIISPEDISSMRTRCGLTQRQLSKLMGVALETLKCWESDTSSKRRRQIPEWAVVKLFEIHDSSFLCRSEG